MKPVRLEFGSVLPAAHGREVHAATFLREGRIVLDRELLRDSSELRRILVHEVYHFVWWTLGNPLRVEYERLLAREMRAKVCGELGWSAEWRKDELTKSDIAGRTRKWREYCCESFCDTAAWRLAAIRRHREFTLDRDAREIRREWWDAKIQSRPPRVCFPLDLPGKRRADSRNRRVLPGAARKRAVP